MTQRSSSSNENETHTLSTDVLLEYLKAAHSLYILDSYSATKVLGLITPMYTEPLGFEAWAQAVMTLAKPTDTQAPSSPSPLPKG